MPKESDAAPGERDRRGFRHRHPVGFSVATAAVFGLAMAASRTVATAILAGLLLAATLNWLRWRRHLEPVARWEYVVGTLVMATLAIILGLGRGPLWLVLGFAPVAAAAWAGQIWTERPFLPERTWGQLLRQTLRLG